MAGTAIKHERNRLVRAAILRGMQEGKDPAEFLEPYTEKLKELALAGEITALRELFDRIDGKPSQQVQLQGDPDQPLVARLERVIVDPNQEKPSGSD